VKSRGAWQGLMTITRLNWPFYAVALGLGAIAIIGLLRFPIGGFPYLACGMALAFTAYFLIVSLGVSHLVYDRSGLYRWDWVDRALHGATRKRFLFCHCGFDDASRELRTKVGEGEWTVLDHYDAARMTEASIRRARRIFPPSAEALKTTYNDWPVAPDAADVVFGLLAIHELRSEVERQAWFEEAKRSLREGGRVVLVEHLRNVANLVAFGPGFLHFHSRTSWRRCWEKAGFRCVDEMGITPWVQLFVLKVS
jgi:SAM-dependent methyltransferase